MSWARLADIPAAFLEWKPWTQSRKCGENGPNENPNGIISIAYNIFEK